MGEATKIEWCDYTFNPWIGCAKVSPGCAHCYAAAQDKFRKWTPEGWGAGKPRRRTSEGNWKLPLRWDAMAAAAQRAHGASSIVSDLRRPRVFCASLADWLDDEVPVEWLADLLSLIDHTPNLDWLLLSKRPGNFEKRMRAVADEFFGIETVNGMQQTGSGVAELWVSGRHTPRNVWVGTTVEDRERESRVGDLCRIPAAVRFLSVEPMLEGVEIFTEGGALDRADAAGKLDDLPFNRDNPWHIHWVICGGESGPGARPMDVEWARALRADVESGGAAFFMKQLGGVSKKRGEMGDFPEDLRVREFPTLRANH